MKESKRIRKVLNYTKQKEALKLARFNETDFTRKSPLNIDNLSKLLIFKREKQIKWKYIIFLTEYKSQSYALQNQH